MISTWCATCAPTSRHPPASASHPDALGCSRPSPGGHVPATPAARSSPVTAAAAAAVAVAVANGALSGSAARSAAVKPPAIRLTLTAQLLSTAAATVAEHPAVRPGPHQWFYIKFVGHDYGQPIQSNENWETFDGRRTAYFQNGQLIVHKTLGIFAGGGPTPLGEYNANATPQTAYNALASLPSNPRGTAGSHRQAGGQGRPELGAGKCRLAVRAKGPRRARVRLPGPVAVEFGDG